MRRILLAVLLTIYLLGVGVGNLYGDEGGRYVRAVREYGDNALRYGRDVYGEKHTPLFVDGLNIYTRKPAWEDKSISSNLSRHQNLFRVLDGLSKVTKDPKYHQAAVETVKYAFENLRSPNGLLYWGGHTTYNAETDEVVIQRGGHELNSVLPYYG